MKKAAFIVLFLLSFFWANSQNEKENLHYERTQNVQPIGFESEDMEVYKADKAFDYKEHDTAVSWWENFKQWLGELWVSFWQWLFGDYSPGGFVAFLVKYLPYLVLLFILGLSIYLFAKANPGKNYLKNQSKGKIFLSDEEKILKKDNIRHLIDKALQEADYRLAIRYYYLLILKKLKDDKYINYQYEKTNTDYIAEIKPKELKNQFHQITRLYEYIWYGDFSVNKSQYQVAEGDFRKIETSLSSAANE